MFACLFLPPAPASSAAGHSPAAANALAAVAREFSPRVEAHGVLVTLDISGLDRLLGDGWAIGRELRRAAADRGLAAHIAVAATRSAAMLLACGRSGLTVARPGEERRLLADLPLSVLGVLAGTSDPSGGSCPDGGYLPLRPDESLDAVARLDARATARDRSASGLADDSRLLSDRPQRQMAATRPPARSLSTIHYPLPTVLRRFRIPVPARVQVEDGAPAHVATDRAGLANGRVVRAAGPWRTSGEWWQLSDARLQVRPGGGPVQVGWNRDEWDVALGDGGIYRLYRDRHRNRWFVDGIVD